ncbi:Clp protease N-terminal domain-containing protein [Streptomyces sp. NBC_01451]|uniref:Clp protease N-terminal domain-containing protein n=1 Tax=Streptomyces sp. NBC_01451 TaxID=2903872 RepID=UPI002E311F95|nr:Clp protease N-terminal domain-containing protein [Streptomyces sp. NBC_01451]
MFERFTSDARAVVRGAVEHSERAGSRSVDAEHLLLALLDREAGRASFALASLGLAGRKESVRAALADARRRAGLSQAEADALAGLGIDVSDIVSRIEEVHGVGAMSGDRRSRGRLSSGRRTFSRDAKEVLERCLRIAVAHRDRRIGDDHILLALTARPGVPAEVLADQGVTHEVLSRVLYGGGEAKAG